MRESKDASIPDERRRRRARPASGAEQPPGIGAKANRTRSGQGPSSTVRAGGTEEKPRRGRRPGSVALTEEIFQMIVTFVRAGTFAWVAAEAAGVDPRTFRDWMARGEGRHPTRAATPALIAFAREVRSAEAQARVAAEARVYRDRPEYWLGRVGRSRAGREGWTEPVREPGEAPPGQLPEVAQLSDAELNKHLQMVAAAFIEGGVVEVPRCPDRSCRCAFHTRRRT